MFGPPDGVDVGVDGGMGILGGGGGVGPGPGVDGALGGIPIEAAICAHSCGGMGGGVCIGMGGLGVPIPPIGGIIPMPGVETGVGGALGGGGGGGMGVGA